MAIEYRTVHYVSRDIGYGVEDEVVKGYWGNRDWTGKREFFTVNGFSVYLFDDEVQSDEHMDLDWDNLRFGPGGILL